MRQAGKCFRALFRKLTAKDDFRTLQHFDERAARIESKRLLVCFVRIGIELEFPFQLAPMLTT